MGEKWGKSEEKWPRKRGKSGAGPIGELNKRQTSRVRWQETLLLCTSTWTKAVAVLQVGGYIVYIQIHIYIYIRIHIHIKRDMEVKPALNY